MDIFLIVLSFVAIAQGISVASAATSAMHEIFYMEFFVLGAILFVGGAIVRAIKSLKEKPSADNKPEEKQYL